MPRKKKDLIYSEFIGVKMPEGLDNCLRLQSLLQGKGRSQVVRLIVEQYAEDNDWSEEVLVKRYANYLFSLWYLRYRETVEFAEYLDETQMTLLKGGKISVTLVIEIIHECGEQRKRKSISKSKPE